MNITQATAAIEAAAIAGLIDQATARAAYAAVRETSYYGNRMTSADRARIVRVRFGIAA